MTRTVPTITPAQIRTMHALGVPLREIEDLLGPRCRSRLSACLRQRVAATYRDAKGIVRYISNGARQG